jgi:hypothetical protein
VIFPRAVLAGIAEGRIDLALRRAARAPAKAGGTQVTDIGVIAFDSVGTIPLSGVSAAVARRAGFASRAEALAFLAGRNGPAWRVTLRLAGPDPRLALRDAAPGLDEIAAIAEALARLDRASPRGAWTGAALAAIAAEPGRRAPDLAARLGWPAAPFKTAVRHLKSLGLTESLDVGYRLSARGRAFLSHPG